jgi:hypothetical protein
MEIEIYPQVCTQYSPGTPHFFFFLALWGRYNMFSSCCDKDLAIIFTTARLPDKYFTEMRKLWEILQTFYCRYFYLYNYYFQIGKTTPLRKNIESHFKNYSNTEDF